MVTRSQHARPGRTISRTIGGPSATVLNAHSSHLNAESRGGVGVSRSELRGKPGTRSNTESEQANTHSRQAGVCRGAWGYRYILGCVSVCGFVTTLSGGLCGCCVDLCGWSSGHLCSGVLGLWCQIFYSHTCVYFSATGKRKNVAPPTVRSLWSRSP